LFTISLKSFVSTLYILTTFFWLLVLARACSSCHFYIVSQVKYKLARTVNLQHSTQGEVDQVGWSKCTSRITQNRTRSVSSQPLHVSTPLNMTTTHDGSNMGYSSKKTRFQIKIVQDV
jgi:hypothetical protein